jgi:hypothetical protein
LLGGAAAVVLIILLSGGGDEQPSTGASATSPVPGQTGTGTTGATKGSGATGAQGSKAKRRALERARQKARAKRGAQGFEQGRLGAQTGGAPAQGERADKPGASAATIEVVGGAAVGGAQRVRFPKGERARLIVKSDTDQVVEIRGYGLSQRVQAGGSARFYFDASKAGLFEIQLERGQTLIGVLEVG